VERGRIEITDVVKRFGATEVLRDVSIDVEAHETVALLGPSGCGKTTLLRSIAGLERVDGGRIAIDGRPLSAPGVHVRPEERRIGMVFQDWALFPHLTVGENVAFGLAKHERRGDRVAETLALVGLDGLAHRLPATLSGGQQQRVALARALAPRPQAILLDEPFSNLDTVLRVQVRTEVHRLLHELGITTVFVTHDQEEAFVLGDRVAVMHAGRIEQFEHPAMIYQRPASRWIADFVGDANLLSAEAVDGTARSVLGTVAIEPATDGRVELLLRPEQLTIESIGPDVVVGTPATVELVEYYGHDHVTIVVLDDQSRLRVRAPGAPRFDRGQRVAVSTSASAAVAFPAGTSPDDASPADV
jgi:iron(III) transport system ATP-binding protein